MTHIAQWRATLLHPFSLLVTAACHYFSPCRQRRDATALAEEGMRQKEAMRECRMLEMSTNRYENMPAGGPPGSPKRLRAAAAAAWSISAESVARRMEKRQLALAMLAEKKALNPAGATPSTIAQLTSLVSSQLDC